MAPAGGLDADHRILAQAQDVNEAGEVVLALGKRVVPLYHLGIEAVIPHVLQAALRSGDRHKYFPNGLQDMIYYGYNVWPNHLILQEKHMRCFTVNWNDNAGEAKISYADWFKPETDPASQMVVLDALQDAISELIDLYNETLKTKPIKDKT